jgi:hypothetical protein
VKSEIRANRAMNRFEMPLGDSALASPTGRSKALAWKRAVRPKVRIEPAHAVRTAVTRPGKSNRFTSVILRRNSRRMIADRLGTGARRFLAPIKYMSKGNF